MNEKYEEYKDDNLKILINSEIKGVLETEIFFTFYKFNKSIIKTNFFNRDKSALSYRLDASKFLDKKRYPEIPFGIFMIFGREFKGFHIRFRDISRGGVRLILSNPDSYDTNQITLF